MNQPTELTANKGVTLKKRSDLTSLVANAVITLLDPHTQKVTPLLVESVETHPRRHYGDHTHELKLYGRFGSQEVRSYFVRFSADDGAQGFEGISFKAGSLVLESPTKATYLRGNITFRSDGVMYQYISDRLKKANIN